MEHVDVDVDGRRISEVMHLSAAFPGVDPGDTHGELKFHTTKTL